MPWSLSSDDIAKRSQDPPGTVIFDINGDTKIFLDSSHQFRRRSAEMNHARARRAMPLSRDFCRLKFFPVFGALESKGAVSDLLHLTIDPFS